jgi:NADP-dependent aldehyde dehydrogenase
MIIGNRVGYRVLTKGESRFQTFNPRLNSLNKGCVCVAADHEIELALELAKNAFHEYNNISGLKKSQFFLEIVRLIECHELELFELFCSESGLEKERASVELTRTKNQILNFAKLIESDQWRYCSDDTADLTRIPPKPKLVKGLFPLGPVVVFGASNFPFAYSTIGGDSISALAAGCPIIVKSHPFHAQTGDLMAEIVLEAALNSGIPEGVFSNLNSDDYSLAEKLVLDSRIKAIGFTGSINGGKAIMNLVQKREVPIPVFAEMGSSNPVIVFPSIFESSAEKWTSNLALSITNSAGQFCTKPGLIFILNHGKSNDFIQQLKNGVLSKDFQCLLHPTILRSYEKQLIEKGTIISIYKKEGEKLPNFVSPSIGICSSEVFLENEFLGDEVFGPFSLIVKCETILDLKKCIYALKGQLTGTILSDSIDEVRYSKIVEELRCKAGRMIFNGVPTGVEVVQSMQHGGPFPSSSDSQTTAVGLDAINRFVRPLCFQNYPEELLPDFLN